MKSNTGYVFIFLGVVIFQLHFISSKECNSDKDCPDGKCATLSMGRETIKECVAGEVCRGRTPGKCPTGKPAICVFKETSKLINVKCCEGSAPVGGNTNTPASTSAPTSNTTESTNVSRLLQDELDCFQCYPKPGGNKSIAGSFECILASECRGKSAFSDACNSYEEQCKTGDNMCGANGTCAPKDPDDPIKSFGCHCKTGFGGSTCEKTISNKCSFDCGDSKRGNCVKGECECEKGYTGDQCLGCTSDESCNSKQEGGTCDIKSGVCKCNSGFDASPFCSSTSSSSSSTCSTPCGNKGRCFKGQCVCLTQCAGNQCKACAESNCEDCSSARNVHYFDLIWSMSLVIMILSVVG